MVGLEGDEAKAALQTLRQAGSRATATLRSARHPDGSAIGDWTETDLAVHLSHVVDAIATVAKGTGGLVDDVWDLGHLTALLLAGESQRDLVRLADRIDASVDALIAALEPRPPDERCEWLVKGVDVPLSVVAGQALNEVVVHGRDLAAAEGQAGTIDRAEAALILRGFLFPILGSLGRAMVDQNAGAGVKATFDVRLRGGGRAYLIFDDGNLVVSDERPKRVDCRLSVDPAAFLLVAWGRTGQWPAILRGQLFAWGRKPWLGLKLRALLRNP